MPRSSATLCWGRLGFQLARRRDERHQRDVDIADIGLAHVGSHLADGFEEGQAFDVAHGAADFAQHEIQGLGFGLGKGLDGVRHMRDHLHGGAQKFAAAFAGDDIGIDPTRRDIVGLARRHAGEAFVMAEIEICLCPVVGHIDFAMLIGAHRARIDVQIGIELADAHLVAARLQEGGQRGAHESFAERGDHAAGDENIPRHGRRALSPYCSSAPAPAWLARQFRCGRSYQCQWNRTAAPSSSGLAAIWQG